MNALMAESAHESVRMANKKEPEMISSKVLLKRLYGLGMKRSR